MLNIVIMTVIKAVALRKNLKEILESIYSGNEDIVLDYYGKLFKIEPLTSDSKNKSKTQATLDFFTQLPEIDLADPIFDENNPTKEKENIRNSMASKYEK